MLKLKYLFHQNIKYSLLCLIVLFSFPLNSLEVLNNDLPFFYAISDKNLDNKEIQKNLYHSAIYGTDAIRLQSALTLSRLKLVETDSTGVKDFIIVSEVCTNLLEDGFTDTVLLENLLDSYYLQEDLISIISTVDKYVLKDAIKISPKIGYYRFLAEIFKGSALVESYFRELLLGSSSSVLLENAYENLKETGIKISDSTCILADFKSSLHRKAYLSAGNLMIRLLHIQKEIILNTLEEGYIVDNVILSPVILDEMYKTAGFSGRNGEFLRLIEELLVLPGNSGFEPGEVYSYEFISGLYETAGFLKRRAGRYAEASNLFKKALSYVNENKYERILWYWYNSIFRHSPEMAADQIEFLADKWINPDYFSDILSELATYFVQKGQWTFIHKILNTIESSEADESVTKYAYLTARAGMESYIKLDKKEINRLLSLSYSTGYGIASGLYYRILAGNYIKIFDIRQLPWMFNRTVSRNPDPLPSGMDGSSLLVFGWLEYEHSVEAYNYIMAKPFSDFSLVRRTALELLESQNFAKSIRLLNKYSRVDGFNLNRSDLKLIYPDAYNEEIVGTAEKESLEWYVFTALVREESHFQHKVVSSAGAVGLSQLMPSTAADVAARLRFSNYDLKDAQINLMFGGWYLGNLDNRTDVLSDALFAYNGGLTRVRRWRDEYSSLPDDLFLEAIPYKETSQYGRKLLVSSVIYGYLYDGIQPNDIISLFYRN